MDLVGLDKDFNMVGYIPFLNLQWQRRYYECGKWTAQIAVKDYDPRIAYVYTPDRPELGVLERVESQKTVKGNYALLSGRFMEHIFDRQIAYPEIIGNMPLTALVDKMINHQWYKPDIYTIKADEDNPTDSVEVKWERQPIGQLFYETLKTLEMSPRMIFNDETNEFTLKIWQGLDRTQSQNENSYVLFSEDSCYVSSLGYIEDTSSYKNVAMMLYGDSKTPNRHDEYLTSGAETRAEGRRWLLMNSSEEKSNAAMKQEGLEELQRYPIVRQAEVTVLQDGLYYMTDYDLGDKCDIVSHEFQKSFEARISGVDEVWKEGIHTVKLIFGEQLKTSYAKMKRYTDTQNKKKIGSGSVAIESLTNADLEAMLK